MRRATAAIIDDEADIGEAVAPAVHELERAKRLGLSEREHLIDVRRRIPCATDDTITEHAKVVLLSAARVEALRAPLAAKLRALMADAGVSSGDVGAALNATEARVAKMREGRAPIEEHHLEAIERRIPAARELVIRLREELAEEARRRGGGRR